MTTDAAVTIRPGKPSNIRIEDTELADLFAKLRGVGIAGAYRLLTLRQVSELTGVHHETWRWIEKRRTYEPGPEILRAAALSPFAQQQGITYQVLVEALKRDRSRLFAALYETNFPS